MKGFAQRAGAAALLAAAACGGGDSGERKAFDQLHTLCNQVAPGSGTLAQAAATMNSAAKTPFTLDLGCPTNLIAAPGRQDTCQYGTRTTNVPVCRFILEWQAFDNDLCNNFNCFYYCELRTQGTPGQTASDPNATVCGTDWESGQPPF